MFSVIKNDVTSESYNYIAESLGNDDLRDTFLDDPEAAVIGAENDPEISKFIESIPEDDELDPLTDKDIAKLASTNEAYDMESDSEIDDEISSGDYNEFDEIAPVDEAYEPEADSSINDVISSGDYNEFDDITPMSDKNIGTPYSDESDSAFDDEISSGSYDEFVG